MHGQRKEAVSHSKSSQNSSHLSNIFLRQKLSGSCFGDLVVVVVPRTRVCRDTSPKPVALSAAPMPLHHRLSQPTHSLGFQRNTWKPCLKLGETHTVNISMACIQML